MRWPVRVPSLSVLFFASVAIVLVAHHASASGPDCSDLGCHILAYCEFDAANNSVCNCQPGTIDTSDGNGTNCNKNAFSVRYIVNTDPGENPTAGMSDADGFSKCTQSALGYYVRKIYDMTEVNCLYESRPDNISAVGYNDLTSPDSIAYFTPPAIYRWVLDTTGAGLQVPPTGMNVDSVQFKTNCSETGCWVIRGVLTTGEAFNSKAAFNTFFLPQADITAEHPAGDISYDFDYSDVEWTFSPAGHPCTSANFGAAAGDISKVSTCCISDPREDSTGGFVANYRPTEAFVNWAGTLSCDVIFERNGELKCWKLHGDMLQTWHEAQASCGAAGGNLATLANSDEMALLGVYLAETPDGALAYEMPGGPGLWKEAIWLGLFDYDPKGDGNYRWVDGSDLSTAFGFRSSGWPNPYEDECIAIHPGGSYWFDQECSTKYAFMCEYSPPSFDPTCIEHVVARPEYAAPKPEIPCYKSYPNMNYADGKAFCEEKGGSLPMIDDAAENQFYRRVLDYKGFWSAWILANDLTNQSRTVDTWGYPDGVQRPTFFGNNYFGDDQWCAWISPGGGWADVACSRTNPVMCEIPRDVAVEQGLTCDSDVFDNLREQWDIAYPLEAMSFLDVGKFKGMNASPGVTELTNLDPFFGQWSFEIQLDEVELRSKAGKLTGTVGVEHVVDTYLGLANFRPTGLKVLDTFATQVNIHLEKTNFFSVSTHGTNDYTFLEYVNMRLVTILWEDRNFAGVSTGTGASGDANGDDEATNRTVRTDTADNVNYVQVTFTLGSKYTVNNNPNDDKYESGLIPLNSVRVGRGTFLDASTSMEHVCKEYEEAEDDAVDDDDQMVGLAVGRVAKGDFDDAVAQDCGPQSSMCTSPSSIPDSFVSFNIPLGKEVFDNQASNDLSNNIFVDFVVNALDPTATGTPNDGDAPGQMKTTLTASIPIVAGGVNIFCDGITAKTDLKDVANADIVVGTASNETELTRLRIVERVASTDLAAVPSTQIDTASIESALMTLVLLGNESYFKTGATNTGGYSLELDDLITLHLMEDGDAGTVGADGVSTNTKENAVIALLNEPADDNSDSNGLDTDGYKLNGAFRFGIARAQGIAKLEPTTELLAICPFNPPRPQPGNGELETCITRRDVRSREYPARTGSPFPTAMEIFNSEVMDDEPTSKTVNTWDLATEEAALARQVVSPGSKPCPGSEVAGYNGDYSKATFADSGYACEAGFMTSILGDSVYSRQLAKDFVAAIRTRYDLNGRYTRAFWINPGYEWTPTQTAGASLSQVSQKIYLFALVTLDENWSRRRMLLQADTDPTANSGSGTGGAKVEFPVTHKSMLASSFNVPEDKVALFEVELQLTPAEACMSTSELQDSIRLTMADYLTGAASSFYTAQITRINVKKGDEDCSSRRRAIRSLLSGFSSATATVQMLVVFKEGEEAVFNEEAFAAMAGVNTVRSLNNAGQVTIDNTFKCEGSNCGAIGAGAGAGASSSSSDKTTLIAGVCGGVGGALVVGAAVALWMRSRKSDELVMATPVQTIDVANLKAQLHDEV